jgi:hypothetical protein
MVQNTAGDLVSALRDVTNEVRMILRHRPRRVNNPVHLRDQGPSSFSLPRGRAYYPSASLPHDPRTRKPGNSLRCRGREHFPSTTITANKCDSNPQPKRTFASLASTENKEVLLQFLSDFAHLAKPLGNQPALRKLLSSVPVFLPGARPAIRSSISCIGLRTVRANFVNV